MLPSRDAQMGELFDIVDKDKSGLLEDKEVYALIKLVKPKTDFEGLKKHFSDIDVDMSNGLDKKEFSKYFIESFKDDDDTTFHKRTQMTKRYATRKPQLSEVFQAFDIDGNGNIDRGELYKMIVLCKPKFKNEDLTALMKEMDTDGNKKIDESEFVEYYFRLFTTDNDDEFADRITAMFHGRRRLKLRKVFDAFDFDANGVLSVKEFATMLKMNGRKFVSADDIIDALIKFDVDDDRKITFPEWLANMTTMVSMMDDKTFNKAVSNMIHAATNRVWDKKA